MRELDRRVGEGFLAFGREDDREARSPLDSFPLSSLLEAVRPLHTKKCQLSKKITKLGEISFWKNLDMCLIFSSSPDRFRLDGSVPYFL